MMPDPSVQPWWRQLPEDYYRHACTTHLDHKFPLHVHGSAALDRALRTGLSTLVSSALGPLMLSSRRRARELEALQFYAGLADRADPAEVFIPPPADVEVQAVKSPLLGYHPPVPHHQLRFQSQYTALHPDLGERYAGHRVNHQVCAQHWTHPGGPRPTLIFLHGYFLDAHWLNSLMFSLRWFYDQGLDIVLFTLPFHGRRQDWSAPYSGFNYFANGICHANEAMLQAVHDVRIVMNYLEQRGVPAIGVSGLSLGGYISALLANADDRLAFVIPNSPMVTPVDMLLEWVPSGPVLRKLLPAMGLSVADFRHLLAVHSPLTWTPVVDADRLLVIGGAGDRFTAPRYVQLLHHHWQGSRMHWFPGNHVLHLHQRRYLRVMRDFIQRTAMGGGKA